MKSRLSYFLILGIIIFTVFTGGFIWINQHENEKNMPIEKSLTFPVSSNYVPSNADLVFHWKIDPTIVPNSLVNDQEKVKLIRNSLFNLISIDFKNDLSKWVGKDGSFAIFNEKPPLFNDWLLVLGINKDLNFEEEWQSILNTSNSSNNNLDNSKQNLFSKQIISSKSVYLRKDKEHILVSSNPEIINSSMNYSKNNSLNNKDKFRKVLIRNNINDGIFLLEISSSKIFNLIGQKKNLYEINKADKLLSSVIIDKENMILEGLISYDNKAYRPINEKPNDLISIENKLNSSNDSIIINNPAKYFEQDYIHPYQKSIISIIQSTIKNDNFNTLKLIMKNTKGNLIWLKDKDWLAITKKSDVNKKNINSILEKNNFLNSSLDANNKHLEIWSKITTKNNNEYEIEENIGAIIEDHEDTYIWSQDLESIANFHEKIYLLNNIESETLTRDNNDFEDILRIRLGKEKTKELLDSFYPYILLRTMLGNQLDYPKNIDISVSIPTINYLDFVKFKIILKTS